MGEEYFRNMIPRMFLNSEKKELVYVGDMGTWNEGTGTWGFTWRRPWFEWEKNGVGW